MEGAWVSAKDVAVLVERTAPFFYHDRAQFFSFISDKYLSLAVPVIVYWSTCLWYHALDVWRPAWSEKYRLHPPEEVTKRNRVSMTRVILMVLLQHLIQTVLGVLLMENTPSSALTGMRTDVDPVRDVTSMLAWARQLHAYVHVSDVLLVRATIAMYWWGVPWLQFWFGCFLMDAWQYALHRTMHEVRFLYRLMHSHHHRLYVPYAFGALYNHPLEGMLLDTMGAELARLGSRMTLRQTAVFFTISTFKTVCDHGGYAFPWYLNPVQLLFPNNAEYHDVHHQSQGLRYNYSQPFFVHFDTLLGTRVDPADFARRLEKKSVRAKPGVDDNDVPVPMPAPRTHSPYTTASVWSTALFVAMLAVPIATYSLL